MDLIKLSTGNISYKLFGAGKRGCLVILPALGASCYEWEHLAQAWSVDYTVLLYDRHGYGESDRAKKPRSPENIASELDELTRALNIEKFTAVGHSMGGMCAYMCAYLYPGRVSGVVLLDPVSPMNYKGRDTFTKKEYKRAGFDKASNLVIGRLLCSLRLGWAMIPVLKQAPPFHYYRDFSKQAGTMILKNSTSSGTYDTAMKEYGYIENRAYLQAFSKKLLKPGIPIQLVLHDPRTMINEIGNYARVERSFAVKIEDTWAEIMKWYLEAADKTELHTAINSAHAIHLSDPGSVRAAIDRIGRKYK